MEAELSKKYSGQRLPPEQEALKRPSSLVGLAMVPLLFGLLLIVTSVSSSAVAGGAAAAVLLGAAIAAQLVGITLSWRKPPTGRSRIVVIFVFICSGSAIIGLFVASLAAGVNTFQVYYCYPILLVSTAILGHQCLNHHRYLFQKSSRNEDRIESE
ncbi:hypothetical protein ACWEPH_19325 [Nocardia beijingensis]